MDIAEHYIPQKTERYNRILTDAFGTEFRNSAPISWGDIGAGYGETMDAVKAVTPEGSKIIGVEPMWAKAQGFCARGLEIYDQPLGERMVRRIMSHLQWKSILLDILSETDSSLSQPTLIRSMIGFLPSRILLKI